MIHIILITLLTFIFAYYTAKIDDIHEEKQEYILSKTNRFIQRACYSIAICIFNSTLGLYSGILFWFVFDKIKNRIGKIKKPLFYLGITDTFFKKYFFLYIIGNILSIFILIFLGYLFMKDINLLTFLK